MESARVNQSQTTGVRPPSAENDKHAALTAKTQQAAKTPLKALEQGYVLQGEGKVVIKRGPNGERIKVKELTLVRDKTLAEKTLTVVKRGLMASVTLGLVTHNPYWRTEVKKEMGQEVTKVYTEDLTPEELAEGDRMIAEDTTVWTKNGKPFDHHAFTGEHMRKIQTAASGPLRAQISTPTGFRAFVKQKGVEALMKDSGIKQYFAGQGIEAFNITNQEDMTAYAKMRYQESPSPFTEVEGRGMFLILDASKGRVLHLPFQAGGSREPNFDNACSLTITNERTGEPITDAANITGELYKAAKQYTILYGALMASVKTGIQNNCAYLLKDDVLDKAATGRVKELISLQGPDMLRGADKELEQVNQRIADIDRQLNEEPSNKKKERLKEEKAELQKDQALLEAHLKVREEYTSGIQRAKQEHIRRGGAFSIQAQQAEVYANNKATFEELKAAQKEWHDQQGQGDIQPDVQQRYEKAIDAAADVVREIADPDYVDQFRADVEANTLWTLNDVYEKGYPMSSEKKALYEAGVKNGLVGRMQHLIDERITKMQSDLGEISANSPEEVEIKKKATADVAELRKGLHIAIREAGEGNLGVATADAKIFEDLGNQSAAAQAHKAVRKYRSDASRLFEATYAPFEIGADGIPRPIEEAIQRSGKQHPLITSLPTLEQATTHLANLEGSEHAKLQEYVDKRTAAREDYKESVRISLDYYQGTQATDNIQEHLDKLGGNYSDTELADAADLAIRLTQEDLKVGQPRDQRQETLEKALKDLQTKRNAAFEPSPISIPGVEKKLASSSDRYAKLAGVQEQINALLTKREEIETAISKEKDVAPLQEQVTNFKAQIQAAESDATLASQVPSLKVQLKMAEQRLETAKETQRTGEAHSAKIGKLEAQLGQLRKVEKNMELEVKALATYEKACKSIAQLHTTIAYLESAVDEGERPSSQLAEKRQALADAQAKASGALDEMFSGVKLDRQTGQVMPLSTQLRTRADRKARMEGAIKHVTFDEVYMDPNGAGDEGYIKVGQSSLQWNEKKGAYVTKNQYHKWGHGTLVEVPDDILKQMVDVYKTETPDSKRAQSGR